MADPLEMFGHLVGMAIYEYGKDDKKKKPNKQKPKRNWNSDNFFY